MTTDSGIDARDAVSEVAHDDAHDREAVLRFVEQFGLILNDAGLPRMPARVFAYVLADDAEIYTASDLAEGLQVSPAAISGAVRMLVQSGMLGKERPRGSRVDHYRVYDNDVWSAIFEQRFPIMVRTEEVLQRLLKDLDPERPGAKRARETLEYYRFMRRELGGMLERWKKFRRDHNLGVHPTDGAQ